MTETTELKDRLERLAQRGNNPGPEWLVASVRHARAAGGVVHADTPRRHTIVTVAIAFVVVVVITVAAIALNTRNRAEAPPASIPNPTVVQLVPRRVATESVSAFDSQPALVSRSEGWVCDRPLRHTVDGGKTWQSIPVPFLGECEFLPGGRAWVGTGGDIVSQPPKIFRIVAGAHPDVTRVDLPESTPQTELASLTFADDDRGWALTSLQLDKSHGYRNRDDLYSTVDGGVHWHLIAPDAPISGGLEFTSATRGWAVDGSVLRRTDDGGHTWSRISVPLPRTISDAPSLTSVFVFGDQIVVDGVRPGAKSPIVPTTFEVATVGDGFVDVSNDNGRTWSLRRLPTQIMFVLSVPPEFDALDVSHWRLDWDGLWVTNDAGRSWQSVGNALFNVLGPGSDGGMSFVTPELGWVSICKTARAVPGALPNGNPVCHPVVARTTDGGRTWTRLPRP